MAKAYPGNELARRVFAVVMVGILAEIAVMAYILML